MQFHDLIAFILLLCLQSHRIESIALCNLGACIAADECPVSKLSRRASDSNIIATIQENLCGNSSTESICCTDAINDLVGENISFSDDDTKKIAAVLKQFLEAPCPLVPWIVGNGVDAQIFEFPWMVLLEFENNITNERKFLCGGSLIGDQYVLTAAHCFVKPNTNLLNVRLGEYDTSKEIDCDHQMICAPPIQNIKAEKIILHEEFKEDAVFHDIALIRLKEKAVYGMRVKLICLPIVKKSINRIAGAEVAGWGLTVSGNTSNILQRMLMPVFSESSCTRKFPRNRISSSQLCAGGVRGVDTCKGDSGGPLFARGGSVYVQYGILSGGGRVCGGDNTVPSIYTKVTDYLVWIIKNIEL